ncbi:MAG: hypothetical protein ABW140_06385 [Candidatus Sedimenticola sp. 6PFRAG1]
MSNTDIRRWWSDECDRIVRGAIESKSTGSIWFELSKLYSSLSLTEKNDVASVLVEWIESDDDAKRSEAIFLVREYKILAAKPALERLRIHLHDCKIPSDPQGYHECQEVISLLQILDGDGKGHP